MVPILGAVGFVRSTAPDASMASRCRFGEPRLSLSGGVSLKIRVKG